MTRDRWTSRLGFVLAAAGSAIGLGNLWKFPYVTWANNGGAFVLVYFLAVLAVGLPIMISEILVGRMTQKSPVGALREALGPAWSLVGGLGVFTGFVILSYYTVIAGWTLRYFVVCLGWSFNGFVSAESSSEVFGTFVSDGPLQTLLVILFMAATMAVVLKGVGGGIEKVARVLMPALFGILLLLLVSALSMKGAGQALRFIFVPDFSGFQPRGALEGLGQAFFSLSLGMGAMITYGSYLGPRESVVRSATLVVILDTMIAVLAAVIMFAVIFSVPGMQEQIDKSTAGMLFITLPELFYTQVPLGVLLAPLFYILVAFAALTSTISLLEVVCSYFIDERKYTRRKAVTVCGLGTLVGSILCALSFGSSQFLSSFSLVYRGAAYAKRGLFEHMDYVASNWFLSVGGFFITLGVGWIMTRRTSEGELVDETTPRWFNYGAWRVLVRYVAPAAVAIIIAAVVSGKDFS